MPHIDLIVDVGPEGIRTPAGRRHVKTCSVCQQRVSDVLALAKIVRASGADASRSGCLSEEQIIDAARLDRAALSRDVKAHLAECERCAAALSEAAHAQATLALPARAASLPAALRARIRERQPAMPLAAIPRDITRPSASRKLVRRRKPKSKRRRST